MLSDAMRDVTENVVTPIVTRHFVVVVRLIGQ